MSSFTSLGNFKMFIMLPVMFLARKLDSEDQNQVRIIRIAYVCIQAICVLVVFYVNWVASSITESKVVYVPPAPQPFAPPNAAKKYTQIAFNAHVLSSARSLLASSMIGLAMTCGLHYYRGMLMGLAMQVIMGPINLWESGVVQAVLRNKLNPEHGFFDEKLSREELEPDAEIVDAQGQPVAATQTPAAIASSTPTTTTAGTSTTKPLPDLILDTWDAGVRADVAALLSRLNASNVNTAAPPDQWTAAMILAGLKQPQALVGLRRCLEEWSANPAQTDQDGWTCLHWAAFHGNEAAARYLKEFGMALDVLDNEKQTPAQIAEAEGNSTIAELLLAVSSKKDK